MGVFGIILILVAIAGLLGIFHIIIYNHIQFLITKIEHVEGIIDENLRKKYDSFLRAEDAIKNSLYSKKDYLKEFKNLKEEKISNFELFRKLNEAESIIQNLYNDNEELHENKNLLEVLDELAIENEHLTANVAFYNKHTSSLNAYIRRFPNNIISKIHHVKVKPYFDGKDMTDDDIEDFKL